MDKNKSVSKQAGNTPQSAASLFAQVRSKILSLRGEQVILDSAVAEL